MPTTTPLRCAVIGTGMSATVFHVPFILSLPQYFSLHSVLERSATSTKSVAKDKWGSKVPNLKVVSSLEEVVEDPEVDVVVVSTPNSTHEAYTEAALKNGKNVILEKPSFITSGIASKMFQLATSAKSLIAVYQNRRFDCDFLTLKKVLESGELGELSEVETRYDRYRPALVGNTWKETSGTGQGVVWDLGSHIIDQVLLLFGVPTSITTPTLQNSRQVGSPQFLDNFVTVFYYAPSAEKGRKLPLTVTIGAGILSVLKTQLRFVIKGSKGSWVKYGIDPQEPQLKMNPPMALTDPAFGVESTELEGTLSTVGADGAVVATKIPTEKGDYLKWYKATGEALQSGNEQDLVVSPKEAVNLIKIIELIYKSYETGTRVKVDIEA